MKKKKSRVEQIISDSMRKLASRLTPEQRRANGAKSWQTRRANIAKELAGA